MGAISTLPLTPQTRVPVRRLPDLLPTVFRLIDLEVERDGEVYRCMANLYHRQATLSVTWYASVVSPGVEVGALVRPDFPIVMRSEAGRLIIKGLSVPQEPERDLNLFDTVRPERWNEPRLIERARDLMDELPSAFRHLFNAIFWDFRRFARFCVNPASLSNHHAYRGGLLEHTVATAEIALMLCDRSKHANRGLVLVAALLHDAGKADEYLRSGDGTWTLTDRGRLIGHDCTVIEWIAAAAANCGIDLRQEGYQALLHVLTARTNAPEWLGIRKTAMIENEIVSVADRMSGHIDLHDGLAAAGGGWGLRHHHRPAPFTLADRG